LTELTQEKVYQLLQIAVYEKIRNMERTLEREKKKFFPKRKFKNTLGSKSFTKSIKEYKEVMRSIGELIRKEKEKVEAEKQLKSIREFKKIME